MDAIDCIKTRQSVRAFKPEPVDRALLEEVFEAARWSPSYKNSQPWEVVVVSGRQKEALTEKMLGLFEAGSRPTPDLAAPGPWPLPEQSRIDRLYKQRAEDFGVDLADPRVIGKAKKANFAFYKAPHAIYLFQENSLSLWSLFDLGLFAQSFMLAAHAKGLGSVPQAFVTEYAPEIKDFLGISAEKRLVLGLSVGYPDWEARVNKVRADRSEIGEFVRWHE